MMGTTYLLGIDGGGTACRAAIADTDGKILGQGQGGPANIASDMDRAHQNIDIAFNAAVVAAGLSDISHRHVVAVMGLAGANLPESAENFKKLLRFPEATVTSDAVIAHHGAFAGEDGLLAVIGTGSIFLKSDQGHIRFFGGWGFEVGDFASGARLGRRILEETLLSHDGIVPSTAFTSHVFAKFQHQPELLVEFAKQVTPADLARFAPEIFAWARADDACALRLVEEAAHDLNRAISMINQPRALALCLTGGLASAYAPYLHLQHQKHLVEPKGSALDGALALAMKTYHDQARIHGRED